MVSKSEFGLLIVCTANECRSVHAQNAFNRLDALMHWSIDTAGTQAMAGSESCQYVAGERTDGVHKSSMLVAEKITSADLTLTFEYEQRARCVELVPASRSKVFLLNEIVELSGLVDRAVTNGGIDLASEFRSTLPKNWRTMTQKNRMAWMIEEFDAARGYMSLTNEEIADAHGNSGQPHEIVFASIDLAVNKFVNNLVSITTSQNGRN